MSNFSLPHSIFYPLRELSTIFTNFKIVVCKLFQFGTVKNLSFGIGLRPDKSCLFFTTFQLVLFGKLYLEDLTRVGMHQTFSRTIHLFLQDLYIWMQHNLWLAKPYGFTQLLIGLTIWFSQSEVVLHSNACKYRKIERTRLRMFWRMVGEYGPRKPDAKTCYNYCNI